MSQGLVLYTDGGARPNPGNAGWGMHGYLYSLDVPTKPSGNSEHILTTRGYILKSDAVAQAEYNREINPEEETQGSPKGVERRAYDRSIEVTPIHYIDGYGSFADKETNNVGELTGFMMGLRHALEYDITHLQIYTDSEYVCKNLNAGYVDFWSKNNWLKRDMTPASNPTQWKEILILRDRLNERNVHVSVSWIRGHNDTMGNEMADRLATVGVMASKYRLVKNVLETTAADGYWKYTVDKHPFIANRRMYFNTMFDYIRAGEYYLGEHGKDDDLLGKRIADGAYSVVRLASPDPILEFVRNYQAEIANGTDSIIMARLDQLYRADIHRDVSKFTNLAAVKTNDPHRLDLNYLENPKEPITRELQPAKLAMRAVAAVSELAMKLDAYLAGDVRIVKTDLTPILYETTQKNGKKGETTTIIKLKPEYNVGFAALPVQANYESAGSVKSAPVTLTLGIDLLDRNSLKRLEDYAPKVTLITWLEAPNVFRYATVIEAREDKGIWAGVYSNLRIVSEAKA